MEERFVGGQKTNGTLRIRMTRRSKESLALGIAVGIRIFTYTQVEFVFTSAYGVTNSSA